jgi:hypothetical protein
LKTQYLLYRWKSLSKGYLCIAGELIDSPWVINTESFMIFLIVIWEEFILQTLHSCKWVVSWLWGNSFLRIWYEYVCWFEAIGSPQYLPMCHSIKIGAMNRALSKQEPSEEVVDIWHGGVHGSEHQGALESHIVDSGCGES